MNNDKLTFEQHVQSECLCLLGYFAHQAGRSKRSDIINELVDSTFSGKTPDAVARKNWWGRKFGNIAYAWNANGLAGAVVHGVQMPAATGKGLIGSVGVQKRIKDNALRYFLENLPKCVLLAQQFLDQGAHIKTQIREALFGSLNSTGFTILPSREKKYVDLKVKSSKKHENWSDLELQASVDVYFEIHSRVSSGEDFVMKSTLQEVTEKSLPLRNKGSVERRMSNISAVLIELGLPWCYRFKPLKNVGAMVKKVLARRIGELSSNDIGVLSSGIVQDDVPEGSEYGAKNNVEGSRRLISHYITERSAAAAEEAKEINRTLNNGEYCCEVCGDKPGIRYGVRVIDAHHIKPISEVQGEYLVRAQDFLIVCPNCHRAIHRLEDYSGLLIKAKLSRA